MAKEPVKKADDKTQQGAGNKDVEDLKKQVGDLGKALTSITKTLELVGGTVAAVKRDFDTLKTSSVKDEGKKGKKSNDEEEEEEGDIDALSNKQFLKLIEKRVGKLLEPVMDRLDNTEGETLTQKYERQLKEAREKHPDLLEWKVELAKKLKDNPTISIEDAYHLVRKDDPKKAEEIDKKIAEEEKKAKGEKEEEEEMVHFGGLLPTSGQHRKGEGKMDMKAAAEDAWNKVFGNATIQ